VAAYGRHGFFFDCVSLGCVRKSKSCFLQKNDKFTGVIGMLKKIIVVAVGLLASVNAIADSATGDSLAKRPIKYRLREVDTIITQSGNCLPGYLIQNYVTSANIFGSASGIQTCYVNAAAPTQQVRATVWTPFTGSRLLPFVDPTATTSYTSRINVWGEIGGGEYSNTGIPSHGVEWTLGGGSFITVQAAEQCKQQLNLAFTYDLNDFGTTLAYTSQLDPQWNICLPFWTLQRRNGTLVLNRLFGGAPQSLNNREVVVGFNYGDAIEWDPDGTTKTLYAGDTTTSGQAMKINNKGIVVGAIKQGGSFDYSACGDALEPVEWNQAGDMKYLPMPTGTKFGKPSGINDDGMVVGYAGNSNRSCPSVNDDQHAVMWVDNKVIDLNDQIVRGSITLIEATAINNLGQIFATGIDSSEPLKICPGQVLDPATNQYVPDPNHKCADKHTYLLIPLFRD